MNTVYILQGLPGSGKTTWAKDKFAEYDSNDTMIINSDNLKEMLSGNKHFNKDHGIRKEFYNIIFNIRNSLLEKLLIERKNVVIDDINLGTDEYHLQEIYNIANKYKAKIKIIKFNTKPEVCIERKKKDDPENYKHLAEIILYYHEKYYKL